MTIGVRLYLLLIAYAPRPIVRLVPRGWRQVQLRRWLAAELEAVAPLAAGRAAPRDGQSLEALRDRAPRAAGARRPAILAAGLEGREQPTR